MQETSLWWQRPTILVALGIIAVALALLWPYVGEFTQQSGASDEDLPMPDLEYSADELPGSLDPPAHTPASSPGDEPTLAIVYVSGEVVQPDVYAVPVDARVKDVVMAAGGLTSLADSEQINLAARIEDAQHISIPALHAQPIAESDTPGSTTSGAGGSAGPTLVNINTASQAELEELPGIGAALAQRIIDYRNTDGPFTSTDDLREVRGIGPTLFAGIADAITTSP